jgi:hypothetical protein
VVCIGNETYFNRSERTRKVPPPSTPRRGLFDEGRGAGCGAGVAICEGDMIQMRCFG